MYAVSVIYNLKSSLRCLELSRSKAHGQRTQQMLLLFSR